MLRVLFGSMYNVDVDKIVKELGSAKTVLLQLPDGLKPKALELASKLRSKNREVIIWAGSNFGGCDIPNVKVDAVVNVGHAKFNMR